MTIVAEKYTRTVILLEILYILKMCYDLTQLEQNIHKISANRNSPKRREQEDSGDLAAIKEKRLNPLDNILDNKAEDPRIHKIVRISQLHNKNI